MGEGGRLQATRTQKLSFYALDRVRLAWFTPAKGE